MADSSAVAWRDAAFMDPAVQHSLRRSVVQLEVAAVFIALLLFSTSINVFFPADVEPEEQVLLRMLWYPVYLVGLAGTMMRPGRVAWYAAFNVLAIAPVVMVAMSSQWSIDSALTFRRAIALVFSTLFGLYFAARFDWRDMITITAVLFGVMAVGSVLTALAMPSRGIMTEIFPGAWKGMFDEKNEFGSLMARGALVFGALAVLYPDMRRRAWVWGGIGLCAVLVLLSTSKTSLLALLSIPAVMFAVIALRRGAITGAALVCLGGIGAVMFAGLMIWDSDLFFELLGKDPSFTGRTDIWEALFRSISEKPWFGYGYGVFWQHKLGPAYWVREATQWAVPTAHNGWLETTLDIGIIGLCLAGVYIVAALGMAVIRIPHRPEVVYALPYMVLTLVFSFSESAILQRNNLSWMLFVAIAAKLFAEWDWMRAPARSPASGGDAPAAPQAFPRSGAASSGSAARAAPPPVSSSLTLFTVPLRSGVPMIDLSADLKGLAAALDRTRPADGRGRVIMFTSPRSGVGVSLLAREFSWLMAQRAERGVWLFDLDLSRNTQFRALSGQQAQRRFGPVGPALNATLGEEPFWRLASRAEDGEPADDAASLMTLHRVGRGRLFVSRFHPEALDRKRKFYIRAAHPYWEKLRESVELAVIDAPAAERSGVGRALYAEADAVVIVVDEHPEALQEAEQLAGYIRNRGGMPAGVIVNMAQSHGQEQPARHAG